MLQRLKEIYAHYEETEKKVRKGAPATAGLFGMGDDPRRHPCHMEFYEAVEQWVQDYLASEPDGASAYQAALWILSAAAEHRNQGCYWFMYAAQGHAKQIIPLLSAPDCARLLKLYDERYLRRERMPVQKEISKLLRRGAGGK